MNYDNNKINLEKTFAKKLGMRTTAQKLFERMDKNSSGTTLDFKNVEFISRSFAQEYIYQKNKSKIKVNEINMDSFVKDMLNMVENNFEKIKN